MPPTGPTSVIVAGRILVPPELSAAFLADARATYPVAAANPGCQLISFCIEDHSSGAVTVLEQWRSQEALDRHAATPEVLALMAKWVPYMHDEVRVFDVTDQRG